MGNRVSQFDPESLSPVRVKARECSLPYSLTWVDLAPCLLGFDQAERDSFRALASYEKQGLNKGTNSCIVTLRYVVAGEQCERTVFIKQTADSAAWEGAKYRFLSSQGVPTPELLVAISRNQAEVLVLEFLPTIGVDFHSSSQIRELLELVARLNSVAVKADDPASGRGMPRTEFDARVKAALSRVLLEPPSPVDADRWFQGYQIARDALASMPRALSHGELYFQQVGWSDRDGTRKLVMFDLATLARRPRFSDIANILPLLARESGERELELFETYLEALRQFTGLRPSVRQDARELRLTRVVGVCAALPWLMGAVEQGEGFDLRSELMLKTRCLHDDLVALGILDAA
jgi:hypothetical protein